MKASFFWGQKVYDAILLRSMKMYEGKQDIKNL